MAGRLEEDVEAGADGVDIGFVGFEGALSSTGDVGELADSSKGSRADAGKSFSAKNGVSKVPIRSTFVCKSIQA